MAAEAKRYAVIETATGRIVNIVIWNGETDWSPGEGFTAREATPDDVIADVE